MTGLGMKAANVILTVSGGQPAMTLVIAAVVTIILGLGMPTPSAYILAAVLVGPALAKLGYPILQSHMFLLYYAIMSALTPPIAVAALAAAAIADEDPFKIAFSAVRLAAIGFLMPFAFIWNPGLLLLGDTMTNSVALLGAFWQPPRWRYPSRVRLALRCDRWYVLSLCWRQLLLCCRSFLWRWQVSLSSC